VIEVVGTLNQAAWLFLASAGVTLIFGAMRVINLAHGSFYMYGAFVATTLIGPLDGSRFWWGVPLAALAAAGMGVLVEAGVIRWIYGKEHLTQLLATFALVLVFADVAQWIWGSSYRTIPIPGFFQAGMTIAGTTVPKYDLMIVGIAAAVGLGLWLLLRFTTLGWRIRAAVDDRESLEASGVNLRWLFLFVFALGAALAGLSGAIIGPQVAVTLGIDQSILVAAFLVTVIGGLGSITGAALGSLLIGAASTAGSLWAPDWSSAFPYIAMIVVLAVRPWGLLGVAER
jgi:branched-subunit amino acid ABC-type transport system permease component